MPFLRRGNFLKGPSLKSDGPKKPSTNCKFGQII